MNPRICFFAKRELDLFFQSIVTLSCWGIWLAVSVTKMLTTENTVTEYSETNVDVAEIGDFKDLVNSASSAAASLPLADLPRAFQLSFGLIEKVSGLMLSAFIPASRNAINNSESNGSISHEHKSSVNQCEVVPGNNRAEECAYLRHSFLNAQRIKTPENKLTGEVGDADFASESEKSSKLKVKCPDVADGSDCELSKDNIEQRPHSAHSSASSSFVSSEPQRHCETYFADDSDFINATPGLNDASPNKRGRFEESRKDEERINMDHCGSDHSTDLALGGSEGRLQDSLEHCPSSRVQTRQPSACREYGSGVRNSTDLRRWRLTSTDRLNTLIDECERQINGRKLYVCKFCGKVYEIKSSMRYHMKIIHLQMHLRTTEMQCRICGKQFTCVSAVNRHQSKCVLSTYTDGGLHRNKNYSYNVLGSSRSNGLTTDVKLNGCSNSVATTDSISNSSARNQISPGESSPIGLRPNNTILSAFHNFGVPSAPVGSNPQDATFVATSKSSYLGDSIPVGDRNSQSSTNPDCCFSPPCYARPYIGLNMGTTEMNMESYWSSTGNPISWPAFPNLNYNLSEMTPVQLEMCMKAVVRGIHSNLTNTNQLTSASAGESSEHVLAKPSTISGENLSEQAGILDTHRSSLSSVNTNPSSDTSEAEPGFTITKSDEVAIDLSARSHTDGLMIESF